MSKESRVGKLISNILDNLERVAKPGVNATVKDLIPPVPTAAAAGAGVGGGVLASLLMGGNNDDKLKKNIELYQAIESPSAHEEDIIDNNIYKNSSMAYDVPAYMMAASVPGYMALSTAKNKIEKGVVDEGRKEVGELRDKVNAAYREDMLKAYGVADEDQLKELVLNINNKADDLDKEAALYPTGLSVPAAVAMGGAIGLGGFATVKNMADKSNHARRQNKEYLSTLDKLYRERLVSPTIRDLPFTEEELLAMELYKNTGRKKAPVVEEGPKPIEMNNTQEIDMDDEDLQSIMSEL